MSLHSLHPCQLTANDKTARGVSGGKGQLRKTFVVDYLQMDERKMNVYKTHWTICPSLFNGLLLLITSRGPSPEALPRIHTPGSTVVSYVCALWDTRARTGDYTLGTILLSAHLCSDSSCLLLSQPQVLEYLKANFCCIFKKDLAICMRKGVQ